MQFSMNFVRKYFLIILSILLAGTAVVNSGVIVTPYGGSVAVENDEEAVVDVTLTNNGDQDVLFKISFDNPPEEEEGGARPLRDELEDGLFALFQDNGAWGWLDQVVLAKVGHGRD